MRMRNLADTGGLWWLLLITHIQLVIEFEAIAGDKGTVQPCTGRVQIPHEQVEYFTMYANSFKLPSKKGTASKMFLHHLDIGKKLKQKSREEALETVITILNAQKKENIDLYIIV